MSKSDQLAQKFGANLAQTISLRAEAQAPQTSITPADKYEGAIRTRAFAELPVSAVVRDESQPREEFDPEDLRRLAESIKRFGQLAPIRVRHDADRNRWVVLVGERRWRACQLAGLERVRVEFVDRSMTEADILAEQVVENAVRADLLPVEQGKAYQRLMEYNGWSAKDLAESIGVELTAVYRSLALLRLPEDVAKQVDTGQIKATAAYEIAKLPTADDQRAVADAVVSEQLDHKATVKAVSRRRTTSKNGQGRGGKGKHARLTERVIKTEAGPKVTIEHRRGLDGPTILAALDEARAKVAAELQESLKAVG
jgi:ParB family transcriptional regulator, chromosome partitioning protein